MSSERPDLDDHLEALADGERRKLLFALREDNPRPAVPVGHDDTDAGANRSDVLKMRHNHLPRLEEMGLVRWDRGDSNVVRGPQFDEVVPLLEALPTNGEEPPGREEPPADRT